MMRLLVIFLPGLLPCLLLYGVANPGLFDQFPNRHFVETGSYLGAGIELACHAGFEEVHSIELGKQFYDICQGKFAGCSNVHLWFGDSAEILDQVIKDIEDPITFWLDGHWSDGGTAMGSTYTPILKELEAIKNHPVKTHTILIDDIRCFSTSDFDYIELAEVIQKILDINPEYRITYQDGFIANDILIATVPPAQ